MPRLYSLLRECYPCIMILALLVMGVLIYWCVRFYKKQPKIFWAILITAMVMFTFTFTTRSYFVRVITRVATIFGLRPPPNPEWFIYDTDPRNNDFIKGNLGPRDLRILDSVLLHEKNDNDGMRLDNTRLNEYSKYDPQIIDAYDRWRKCKDMRRSYHKSIYPDERRLYYYLRN